MIIWGTRGLTSTVQTSQFFCPQCATTRTGNLRQVRRFFTLYFIPLIPMHVAGRFVECGSCAGTFAEEILSIPAPTHDPIMQQQAALQNENAMLQMLRVMVMAAMADDQVDQGETRKINELYSGMSGTALSKEVLESEIAMARNSGANLNTFMTSFAPTLVQEQKERLITIVFEVMSASGPLKQGHQQQLAQLATTLSIPQDQFRDIVERASSAGSS